MLCQAAMSPESSSLPSHTVCGVRPRTTCSTLYVAYSVSPVLSTLFLQTVFAVEFLVCPTLWSKWSTGPLVISAVRILLVDC